MHAMHAGNACTQCMHAMHAQCMHAMHAVHAMHGIACTVLHKYSNTHAYTAHITDENIRGEEQYPLNARTSCQEI